ncbi:MAG TPA: hypothetical protein VEF76_04050 [Patescibacteria group bacterium]|nr:hypothetical protein [Patescibacteria group bacterium]
MQDGQQQQYLHNFRATESFLEKLNVKFHREGNDITVEGDLDISYMKLRRIPDLWMVTVNGDFNCSHNKLRDLKGFPKHVTGNIDASSNRLKSLEGAPEVAEGDFRVQNNKLANLGTGPAEVKGNYWAQHNPITTLAGGAEKVAGDFLVYDTKIKSTEHAPQVGKIFHPGYKFGEPGPQQTPKTNSNFVKPQQAKPDAQAGLQNPEDAPDDAAPPEQKAAAKTKFAKPEGGNRILTQEELKEKLKLDAVDYAALRIRDAQLVDDKVVMRLDNHHTIAYGRDRSGQDFIGTQADAPFDATTAIAITALAKTKAWDNMVLKGDDEQRALLFLATQKAGLTVTDPPPASLVDMYRDKFEAAQAPAAPAAPKSVRIKPPGPG